MPGHLSKAFLCLSLCFLVACPAKKKDAEKSKAAAKAEAGKNTTTKQASPKAKPITVKNQTNTLEVDGTPETPPSMVNASTVKLVPRTFKKLQVALSLPAEWREVPNPIGSQISLARPGFQGLLRRQVKLPMGVFHDEIMGKVVKLKWKLINDKKYKVNDREVLRMVVDTKSRDNKFTTRRAYYFIQSPSYSYVLEFATLFQRFKEVYFDRIVATFNPL